MIPIKSISQNGTIRLVLLVIAAYIALPQIYDLIFYPKIKWDSTEDLIVFSCGTAGHDAISKIYMMYPDGSHLTSLTRRGLALNPISEGGATRLPGKEQLLLSHASKRDVFSIVMMKPDTSQRETLVENYIVTQLGKRPRNLTTGAILSPDGKWIAYTANFLLYVMNIESRLTRQLTFTGVAYQPVWSPDSTQLLFTREWSYQASKIYLTDLSANIQELTSTNLGFPDMNWSPDGRWITFSDGETDDVNFYQLNIQTGELNALTQGFKWVKNLTWSPDGNWLVFVGAKDEEVNLYKLPLNGGELQQLTQRLKDNIGDVEWSTDGKTIYFSSWNIYPNSIYFIPSEGGIPTKIVEMEDCMIGGVDI